VAVRSVNTGISLRRKDDVQSERAEWASAIVAAQSNNLAIKAKLEAQGFIVQSTRINTNPITDFLTFSRPDWKDSIDFIADIALKNISSLDTFNFGPANSIAALPAINHILIGYAGSKPDFELTYNLSAVDGVPDWEASLAVAKEVLAVAAQDASAPFKFAASFQMPPSSPFSPGILPTTHAHSEHSVPGTTTTS
jgi:hypothetical protein